MEHNGKAALVTGAGKGIGRGIALALARAGYAVAVADIDEAGIAETVRELEASGAKATAVRCDVSKREEVDAAVRKTVESLGSLDVLVNNAGIFPFVSFAEMTEGDWDRVMDVNLKSAFFCSQAALKAMPDGGRIVNVSSIASLVGFAGLVHYCASKGGMNAMVRALALETAARNITVNAVAPGGIATPGASQGMTDETVKQTVAAIPAARMGTPEDIANAVVFLASDKADYITGQTLIVDGGWTLR